MPDTNKKADIDETFDWSFASTSQVEDPDTWKGEAERMNSKCAEWHAQSLKKKNQEYLTNAI